MARRQARCCRVSKRSASSSAVSSSDTVLHVLERVASGEIAPKDAVAACQRLEYEALGEYAKIDTKRLARTGFPEVVYAEGKTPEQVASIMKAMVEKGVDNVMATRVSREHADFVQRLAPYRYHETARILASRDIDKAAHAAVGTGSVCVLAAGTSDLPVAEEAAVTLELARIRVTRLYDVGVAGIHRLLQNQHVLHESDVAICVAGMDGAMPGVVVCSSLAE
ncbi:hypothetical protein PINS_up002287 [Pythium insidiosum]|nr:hypothetical protein PINS_up002287 [Pythium insidiosum]